MWVLHMQKVWNSTCYFTHFSWNLDYVDNNVWILGACLIFFLEILAKTRIFDEKKNLEIQYCIFSKKVWKSDFLYGGRANFFWNSPIIAQKSQHKYLALKIFSHLSISTHTNCKIHYMLSEISSFTWPTKAVFLMAINIICSNIISLYHVPRVCLINLGLKFQNTGPWDICISHRISETKKLIINYTGSLLISATLSRFYACLPFCSF